MPDQAGRLVVPTFAEPHAHLDRAFDYAVPAALAAAEPGCRVRVRFSGRLVDGFVLQAANPKALMFFVALLPQFIEPHGSLVGQVAILAVTSVVIEFFVLLAYGAAAGRMTSFATQPRYVRLTNRVAGTMLVGAGVGVAAIRR